MIIGCANSNKYSTQNDAVINLSNINESESESGTIINAAVVLEGGGLRTTFTSGVLDVFMENGLEFSGVIGVSAGALNAANYIAKHIGRSARINIMHSNDINYYGIIKLLTTGSIFNFNYMFYSPIKDLYPYNEDILSSTRQRFHIGATNCETAKIEYFERNNYEDLVHVLQASSSMQLLSKIVDIDGKPYVDGAISDPIGYNKAFAEGYDKVVLVLARHYEYIMEETPGFIKYLYKRHYRKYPELVDILVNESERYNLIIEEIKKLEKEEKIFVIRPSREINIGLMERDPRKLLDLYFQGRDDARLLLPQMLEYLNR